MIEQAISPTLSDAHRAAVDDANRWRGYCIDKYTRAETRMREAIDAMLVHPDGATIKRPSMFGQHVAVLAAAVAIDGVFAKSGSKVRDALDRCGNGFQWRNIVSHAVSDVWIDRHGRWLWHYTFQPAGKDKPITSGTLTRDEARKLACDLKSSIDRLDDHLQDFIRTLDPTVTK